MSEKAKKLSTGVFMTVWQSMPHRPEVQMLMKQQHQIEQLTAKLQEQDARLTRLEESVEEIKHIHLLYQSFQATFNILLENKSE